MRVTGDDDVDAEVEELNEGVAGQDEDFTNEQR